MNHTKEEIRGVSDNKEGKATSTTVTVIILGLILILILVALYLVYDLGKKLDESVTSLKKNQADEFNKFITKIQEAQKQDGK